MSMDLFSCDCECGCAAKLSPRELRSVLDTLNLPSAPELLIGPGTMDDAGVYRLSDDLSLILTVDFFPPVARDPHTYGQIAAANALSDVYAMGGTPIAALATACFPARSLGPEVLAEIMAGAADKLAEANTVLAGGHSVVDPQPKFGLSVTGTVHPDRILDNAGARTGDRLILTKPLGTGVSIMAAKAGLASVEHEAETNRVMAVLNATAARLAVEHGVRACTDITGFGLLGHAMQMARASGVSMRISSGAVPKLNGACKYAAMGMLSSAAYSNRDYVGDLAVFDEAVSLPERDLLFDPQTSGGLLLACPRERSDALIAGLRNALSTDCACIGSVVPAETASTIYITA